MGYYQIYNATASSTSYISWIGRSDKYNVYYSDYSDMSNSHPIYGIDSFGITISDYTSLTSSNTYYTVVQDSGFNVLSPIISFEYSNGFPPVTNVNLTQPPGIIGWTNTGSGNYIISFSTDPGFSTQITTVSLYTSLDIQSMDLGADIYYVRVANNVPDSSWCTYSGTFSWYSPEPIGLVTISGNTINWVNTGAPSYFMNVYPDDTFSFAVVSNTGMVGTSFDLGSWGYIGLTSGVTYWLGVGNESPDRTMATCSDSWTKPYLPVDGSTIFLSGPMPFGHNIFTWSSTGLPDSYYLSIFQDSGFSILMDQISVSGTTYDLTGTSFPGAVGGQPYYIGIGNSYPDTTMATYSGTWVKP